MDFDPYNWEVIIGWSDKVKDIKNPIYSLKLEAKKLKLKLTYESLSHLKYQKLPCQSTKLGETY